MAARAGRDCRRDAMPAQSATARRTAVKAMLADGERACADRSARGAGVLAQPSVVGAVGAAEPAGAALRALVPRRAPASCCATTTTAWSNARPRCLRAPATATCPCSTAALRLGDGRPRAVLRRQRAEQGVRRARRARSGTPSISADELNALLRRRHRHGGARQPAVRRIPARDRSRARSTCRAPSWCCASTTSRRRRDTLVVVNCAGRTRSIIGAQSLINAGVPNKVVALRNGTMGWQPRRPHSCDSGKSERAPAVSREALAWPKPRPRASRKRFGIEQHRPATHRALARGRPHARSTSSTCATRTNTRPAIVPGAVSAPGGQLVQATDQYVGTLRRAHRAGRRRRQCAP